MPNISFFVLLVLYKFDNKLLYSSTNLESLVFGGLYSEPTVIDLFLFFNVIFITTYSMHS